MQRDQIFLLDIRESAKLALSYLSGVSIDEFHDDRQLQDAVIRRLEIIGEAARRLSDETRLMMPDIPWADLIGMRNVMIHEYDDVDLSIVWDTVKTDLEKLIAALKVDIPLDEDQ
jgi:uncharacterized protein with HEPN domain